MLGPRWGATKLCPQRLYKVFLYSVRTRFLGSRILARIMEVISPPLYGSQFCRLTPSFELLPNLLDNFIECFAFELTPRLILGSFLRFNFRGNAALRLCRSLSFSLQLG